MRVLHVAGTEHLYGIPEHATAMSLKPTVTPSEGDDRSLPRYSEPYRLYTLDVFEYELDSPAALYGAIPVMVGHRAGSTAGVFWFNPTETFVDVEKGMCSVMSFSILFRMMMSFSRLDVCYVSMYRGMDTGGEMG